MKVGKTKLLLLILVCAACSDVRLGRPKDGGIVLASAGGFCLRSPEDLARYTKFLFVIDKSGSNNGTDRRSAMRASSIEAFYQKHAANIYIKWGYIAFNGSSATPFISDGNEKAIFSSNPADMVNALNLQRGRDMGSTPYLAALQMSRQAIETDLRDHPEEDSQYIIFFMSDGGPTDGGGGARSAKQPHFDAVASLINLAPGKVTLSTAYYGPANKVEAAAGLQKMAEVGRGRFVNTNDTTDFKFDDLMTGGDSKEAYKMRSFFVYNVTSAICFDNALGADSDADGLCDKDERTLKASGFGNFDPQNRYSFGHAFSDFIHYVNKKQGGHVPPCASVNGKADEDFDLVNRCEEAYLINTSALKDLGRTSADPLNPDSDGDGALDGIEYFMLHKKSVALEPTNLSGHYDDDIEDAYVQISQHRNPLFNDANLPQANIYDTQVDFAGINDHGQSCYKFRQDHLMTYATLPVAADKTLPYAAHQAGENVVLVYYIQTLENDPFGKVSYNYSFQNISSVSGGWGLNVSDGVFRTYLVPAIPVASSTKFKASDRFPASAMPAIVYKKPSLWTTFWNKVNVWFKNF